jgi:hypothetical protein
MSTLDIHAREAAVAQAREQLEGVSRYCFAHAPRTGGSALLDFLFENLGRDRVLDTFVEANRFNIFEELRAADAFARDFAPHRFVHIHVPVEVQRYFSPEKLAYFTVLRHPFDRIISYYDWCLKIYRETGDLRFGCHPDESLEAFIEARMDDISVFNIYTYFFASLVDGSAVRHDEWRSFVSMPPHEAYRLAVQALSSFYLIAPIEHLDTATSILTAIHEEHFAARREETGAQSLSPLRQVSLSGGRYVTRRNRGLSLRAIELLTQASSTDLVLYEYCMNAFERRWSAFLDGDRTSEPMSLAMPD